MARAQRLIDEYAARDPDWLILSHDTSPWHADHYLAVRRDVPGLHTINLNGTYLTKVFEGPYKDAPKWRNKLIEYATAKGHKPVNTYFFYTTCPGCAKFYGKNYVVGFEQIALAP